MEKLSREKRYDLLFTDIDGTLIDGMNDETGEVITTFEQELEKKKKLSKLLNLILEGNNIIIVVSSTHHGDIRRKLKNLDEVIDDKNKKKVLYFISDRSRGVEEFKTLDKCVYEGIEITLVDNKCEAVNKVLDEFKKANIEIGRIYGMGDSIVDIDMLLKIKELGGMSGLVADEYEICHGTTEYDIPSLVNHENIKEVANNIAKTEFRFERYNLIGKYRRLYGSKFIEFIRASDDLKVLKEKQESRSLEIQEKFLCGVLTRDDLIKLVYLPSLAFKYVLKNVKTDKAGMIYYDEDKYNEVLGLGKNISTHVLERQPDLLLGRSIVKLFDNKQKY